MTFPKAKREAQTSPTVGFKTQLIASAAEFLVVNNKNTLKSADVGFLRLANEDQPPPINPPYQFPRLKLLRSRPCPTATYPSTKSLIYSYFLATPETLSSVHILNIGSLRVDDLSHNSKISRKICSISIVGSSNIRPSPHYPSLA